MDDLKALAKKATEGPWHTYLDHAVVSSIDDEDADSRFAGGSFSAECYGNNSRSDAAYIAAVSPDVILPLLNERDALREALEGIIEPTALFKANPEAFAVHEVRRMVASAREALRPIGPVRFRSANCLAGDHEECATMVEQDMAELGITDCLCDCHGRFAGLKEQPR